MKNVMKLNKKKLRKDFVWNMLGSIAFSASFPIFTILVTRWFSLEISGEFSLLFSTAQMMLMIGNYSVRVYQISDIAEKISFEEYKLHRYLTCIFMLVISSLFFLYKEYSLNSVIYGFLLCFYKMLDALADVYESRLQQKGKLDQAGKSLFIRTILSMIGFSVIAYISKSILYSLSVAIVTSAICSIFFAIIPANKGIVKERKREFINIKKIFIDCFPLFTSTFALQYIINSSKFAMEKVMGYEYQIYFNALFFPAMLLNLFSGMIFRPYIVMMAEAWDSKEKFNYLQYLSKKVILIISGMILLTMFGMNLCGLKIMGLLYKIDLIPYRNLESLMLMSGGLISMINYFYYLLTVIRKQKELMISYGISFFISMIISKYLTRYFDMTGAVLTLVFSLSILCMMLLFIYLNSIKKQKGILEIE